MPLPAFLTSRSNWAFVHDLVMTGIGFVAAVYLRVGSSLFGYYAESVLMALPIVIGVAAAAYRFVGLYRGIWRFASVSDLIQLVKAVTAVIVISLIILFLINRLDPMPRSVPIIQWFVTLVLLGGPRFVYRTLKDRRLALIGRRHAGISVLLVGANEAADLFLRAVANDRSSPYRAVAVVAMKPGRVGRTIRGVPVVATFDQLEDAVARLRRQGKPPHRIVLTHGEGEVDAPAVRQLVEVASRLGLPISRLPRMTEFKDAVRTGRVELRPIAIEDLLGRPQVALELGAIRQMVAGRTVLVTGAGGTIGSELSRQIAALAPDRLILLDNGEFNLYSIDMELRRAHAGLPLRPVLCDVRDRRRVRQLFAEHRPEMVFHAAALKHVPLVEANPYEGVLTNVAGTRNVADAAAANGTLAMVLISTDKAIRPTSIMGATKRVAEAYCQALDVEQHRVGASDGVQPTRFMTVRFGNVLGSSGSVVPLFRRQLEAGGPLTVTHPEMRRYFMTVREAVELVLQASAYGIRQPRDRGKIFVLDMGEPVHIVDLARQMIRLAGYRPEVDIGIEFTGLRPGEKLFEEILDPAETPVPTDASGIFVASPHIIHQEILTRSLYQLETAVADRDVVKLRTILVNIVPGFGTLSEPAPSEHIDAKASS